jgi:xanthine dehydrogenase YagR molybdenum-binding subunit
MGCATATYPYYRMPGGAARITLDKDGRAMVEIAAHEMGMGTATAQTQVTAERLGLPMDKVTFCHGDSRFPGVGARGRLAAVGGHRQRSHGRAARTRAELLKLCGKDSPLHGLKPGDVVGRDGGLGKATKPACFDSYAAILARAGRDELVGEASAPPPLEVQHWSMHSHGAMFCEVRVNEVTGETRVSRFLGSFDCGRILNAKTAASQFRGGIVMGLGLALMEETEFDERNGRIMNRQLLRTTTCRCTWTCPRSM